MKNTSKIKKIGILVTILLLPSIFYLLLYTGEHNFKRLPYYGPKETVTNTDGTVDTIYHQIPYFEFTNQDGKKVTRDDLLGNIYVTDFFFVTCPTICPKMTTNMGYVQQKFKGVDGLRFLSITVNPEHDSIAILKEHANTVHADTQTWDFVTGSKAAIYDIAFKGFFVSAQEDSIAPGGFLHSQYLILVDRKGHVRGHFDGTIHKVVKQELIDAIDILFKEDVVPLKGTEKEALQQKKSAV